MKSLSCVRLFVTSWTVAYQASQSMEIFQARVLEWVANSFSRGSSQPRDWTRVSHIAGRQFTIWATREALLKQDIGNFKWFKSFSIVSDYRRITLEIDYGKITENMEITTTRWGTCSWQREHRMGSGRRLLYELWPRPVKKTETVITKSISSLI